MRYWRKVVPALAEHARVVTYDRQVPSGDLSMLGQHHVAELIGLLSRLDLPSPYVLVAHSMGGLYAQLFARLHPDAVAGIVLIDATHPRHDARFAEIGGTMIRASQWIARNWERGFGPGIMTEIVRMNAIANEIDATPSFPDIPLTVITAGSPLPPGSCRLNYGTFIFGTSANWPNSRPTPDMS